MAMPWNSRYGDFTSTETVDRQSELMVAYNTQVLAALLDCYQNERDELTGSENMLGIGQQNNQAFLNAASANLYNQQIDLSQYFRPQASVVGDRSNAGNLPLTPPGSPEEDARNFREAAHKTPAKHHLTTNCHALNVVDPANETGYSDTHSDSSLDLSSYTPSCTQTANFTYSAIQHAAAAAAAAGGVSSLAAVSKSLSFDNLLETPLLYSASGSGLGSGRRTRTERKPIPAEQKDTKYFERRRRNNAAAKKSRDARKGRECELNIRVAILEKDNAILKAQLATLREEAQNLRTLLFQKRQRQIQMQMQLQGVSQVAMPT